MRPNRRSFLMGASLASQVLSAPLAFAQGNGDRVPTAVIGTGNRGSHLLRGVLEQPNAQAVAVCDIKPDRLDSAATIAAADNPRTYRDWRQVIDRSDIQAVFIATPPHLHAEMAIAALQAGKHVYCEKPIGATAEQVRDLVRVAKESNTVFVSGQQLRSHSQLRAAVAKIHAGAIGAVAMLKAQRHAPSDLSYTGSSADWYFDVEQSGGYLIEQSVHNLDACNWVLGEHPKRACGYGGSMVRGKQPPGRSIFDSGVLSFEYPSGATMSFTQNVFHPRGMPGGGQNIMVFGAEAAVDLLYSTNVYPLSGESAALPLAEPVKDPPHIHIAAFYNCITDGAENPSDITVGATAALTAILGHMAMLKGGTVEWGDLGVDL